MPKIIAGKMEEYYSISERVASIILRFNKRYRLKVVQACTPTSSYNDNEVERLYEDVESAFTKVNTQYTIFLGYFNAKIDKKQAENHAVREYGIGSSNARGELLVEFAERNILWIMKPFSANGITAGGRCEVLMVKLKMKLNLFCVHTQISYRM